MDNKREQAVPYAVEVIKDISGLESIRPVWEQMQRDSVYPIINGDIDRYISVIRGLGSQSSPYVVIIRIEDKPRVIIVGRIEKHQLKIRFGYKELFEPTLSALVVEYGGVIGELTQEISGLVIQELNKKLKEKEFEVVFFNHLRTDSLLYRLSRSQASFLCRTHFPKKELHRSMVIPDSMDSFYAARSAAHRGHLRRIFRKLDSAYPDKVRMVTYTGGDGLEEGIKAASKISFLTYQHALAAGFEDNELTQVLTTTSASKGWLMLSVLYIDQRPCSFQAGLVYNKSYFLGHLGFDPEFRDYSVGIILFIKVLERLCGEHSVETFDFGFGDAEYKKRFGTSIWQEANIYIFAPCLRTVFINAVHTLTTVSSITAEMFLRKTGLLRFVKRWWRDALRDSRKES